MKATLHAIRNQVGEILSEEALNAFQLGFKGEVIMEDHRHYASARLVWNKMIDHKPAIIARCTGTADIILAVNFAREHKLPLSVRGGGHSVAGHAVGDQALVVDLSQMKSVMVDPKQKTAKVQGGATWKDVDHETQAFGLACPGGVVSDTGVGGLTLGGGLSWMRRKVGMSIDNLIGADVVLASGELVHASESENQDLFWALRGGGGNFGIVSCFEFKLMDLGPEVFFTACIYPQEEAEKVMRFWVEYTRDAPNEVTTDCIHWAIPAHPNFPEELHGKEVTVLSGMYAGNPEEGRKIMQPLREITTPVLDLSNVYPYASVQQLFDPYLEKQSLYGYWKCIYLDDLTEEIQQNIIDRARTVPAPETILSIRNLQGAISEVPTEATAFGDRSARFLYSIDTMWKDPQDNEKNIQWTRDYFNEIQQHSQGKVYFNFNADLVGPSDILKDSFGKNYEKLVAIKTKYDPDNFFNLNTNIKPAK